MSLLTSPQASNWLAVHPKLGISLMDHLFNRLEGLYPSRWRAAFSSEGQIQNWREVWAEAFIEDGITPAAIQTSLAAVRRKYPWPPSLPEFLAACRPEIEPERAYHEAIVGIRSRECGKKGEWSHPAIFWAMTYLQYELRSSSYPQVKTRWEIALEREIKKNQWPEIPEPMTALPAPPEKPADPEAAERARQMIREFVQAAKAGRVGGGGSTD